MSDKFNIRDISRKIDRGEIKIEFAKSKHTDRIRPWVDKVLEAVGHPRAFVTDESVIGDFFLDGSNRNEKISQISKQLGIPVSGGDLVYDVANLLRVRGMS